MSDTKIVFPKIQAQIEWYTYVQKSRNKYIFWVTRI